MKKSIFLLACLLSSLICDAQKYDHQWLFGYREGVNMIDFHNRVVEVSYFGESNSQQFYLGGEGSFICNSDGYMELFTNGCAVYDTTWNYISGEEVITKTGTYGLTCMNQVDHTYGALQGTLFLPDLESDSITYLLHKDMFTLENEEYSENLWLSAIYRKENGDSEFEKKYTINEERLIPYHLTAIPNTSKTAWWVLMQRQEQNIFEKYLIAGDTLVRRDTQSIGLPQFKYDLNSAQSQFSPGGKYFATTNQIHGVMLYEFDAETGTLSNFRTIPYPESDDLSYGMCFSPNERFVYVCTKEDMYQIDLEQEDEVLHLGNFFSLDDDLWPIGVAMMFLGPDCRIYVSPGSGTYYMHVIHSPNLKGEACNIQERAIYLPTKIANYLPNIPQYRYLSGCDSTIVFPENLTSTFEYEVLQKIQIEAYPNPFSDMLELRYVPLEKDLELTLYNGLGVPMRSLFLAAGTDAAQLDIGNIASGVYWLLSRDGRMMPIKLVKE